YLPRLSFLPPARRDSSRISEPLGPGLSFESSDGLYGAAQKKDSPGQAQIRVLNFGRTLPHLLVSDFSSRFSDSAAPESVSISVHPWLDCIQLSRHVEAERLPISRLG